MKNALGLIADPRCIHLRLWRRGHLVSPLSCRVITERFTLSLLSCLRLRHHRAAAPTPKRSAEGRDCFQCRPEEDQNPVLYNSVWSPVFQHFGITRGTPMAHCYHASPPAQAILPTDWQAPVWLVSAVVNCGLSRACG